MTAGIAKKLEQEIPYGIILDQYSDVGRSSFWFDHVGLSTILTDQ